MHNFRLSVHAHRFMHIDLGRIPAAEIAAVMLGYCPEVLLLLHPVSDT